MNNAEEQIIKTIIETEKAASDRFNNGDVNGFLDLYRDDVTYTDPMTTGVLVGKQSVKDYMDQFYLGIKIEQAELFNVNVILNDARDMAVLTYNQQNQIRSKKDGRLYKIPLWNCTEIYRLTNGEWKISHANWSFSQHPALLSSLQSLFSDLGYL